MTPPDIETTQSVLGLPIGEFSKQDLDFRQQRALLGYVLDALNALHPKGLDKFRQPSDELEPNERKLLRASLSHLVQAIIQENGQFTFSASLTAPQASKDDDQPAHFELNIIIHDGKTRKASDNNKELLKIRISQGPASGAYFVTYIKANGKNPQPEIDEIITAKAEIPMPRTEDPSNKVDIESLTKF